MNICVIGTGYVGLVTGAVFADMGNEVICVDNDPEKIEMLDRCEMPIYEPGLREIVERSVKDGRLTFTMDLADAVKKSTVVFIAVGTPPRESGASDLRHVQSVAKEIGKAMNGYKVIVTKSTVPVGTGDMVRKTILETMKKKMEFHVVSNPEFLREGTAINDTLYPDRVVIGAPNQKVASILMELYASLGRPMIVTDVYSAEIIKYASNAFLATKISFINAIGDLCEAVGANIEDVVRGVGSDKRVGNQFLNAGLGYGGSCFPKDVRALIHTAKSYNIDLGILRKATEVNKQRAGIFFAKLREAIGDLAGKKIGLWGLAFKPNTDDLREAKALEIIGMLDKAGAEARVYDPVAMENCKKLYPEINVTYCETPYEAAEGAHALAIITEWNEFKFFNYERIRDLMASPIIIDGRNMHDPDRMSRRGFTYYSVGRPLARPLPNNEPETNKK